MSFKKVPTYDVRTGIWSHTEYATRSAFQAFLRSLFKEPGLYEFDESSREFNKQSRLFTKRGYFCDALTNSKDYITYWDEEKERCTQGAIYRNGDKEWYLTRDYYMWLNFLPIYHKEKKKFRVPDIRDAQYHMALYEDMAEFSFKHCAILKKRQMASSYFHAAKMINRYWFEEGFVNKMAGTLKSYINLEGTWKFLEEYRDFLNANTAWIRPSNPNTVLNWQQKIETERDGVKINKGNKSTIVGCVLDVNVTNGVGGPCGLFFHEEAGIAPKMNQTLEFLMPALKSGLIYTGMAICAGSVGELSKCGPLKKMIMQPASKDVLAVPTDLLDEKGTKGLCGLFIPEQWSMPPYIDAYGNSVIHTPTPEQVPQLLANWLDEGKEEADFDPGVGALQAIELDFAHQKSVKDAADYQIYISQHPRNIKEAFASRTASVWPLHLVSAQIERLENKEVFLEYLDIERNPQTLKPQWKATNRLPIDEFPLSAKTVHKEGVIVVHERPIPGSSWGTYVASIDPVRDGKTTTSDSLCSIEIYKNDVEVIKTLPDGSIKVELEPGKMVAFWTGRFDDVNDTNERLSLLLEIYQAQAIVEVNASEFVTFMITHNRQKYLVRKDQLLFLKELSTNQTTYQDYGWKNTGNTFTVSMIPYGVSMMTEELDRETNEKGDTISVRYGVERITDIMLLKEMQDYRPGLNVDRIVAWSALSTYIKIQRAARSGAFQRKEAQQEKVQNLQNSSKNTKLIEGRSPFRHMGQVTKKGPPGPVRSAFRNLR